MILFYVKARSILTHIFISCVRYNKYILDVLQIACNDDHNNNKDNLRGARNIFHIYNGEGKSGFDFIVHILFYTHYVLKQRMLCNRDI